MTATSTKEIFVARQPIFDRNKNVFSYELLFRSSLKNSFDLQDGTVATTKVLVNSFIEFGLPALVEDKKAFINLNRDLLVNGFMHLFPSEQMVAEVLEDVPPEPDVLEACRSLKSAGFELALDDFCKLEGYEPLAELADIIKVDFMETDEKQQQRLVDQFSGRNVRMLAEKVENYEVFTRAREMGYSYFQGYFFAKPEIISGREIKSSKLHHMRLLQNIQRPVIDVDELEKVVREDVSLSYRLLKYMNASFFSLGTEISSIRQALVLLGADEIKKWATMIAVSGMGDDKPAELLATALARARFCEVVGTKTVSADQSSDLFLLGLFSVLDAILDKPLQGILEQMPISEAISSALLGEPGLYLDILDLVRGYETADWRAFNRAIRNVPSPGTPIPEIHREAIDWARRSLGSVSSD